METTEQKIKKILIETIDNTKKWRQSIQDSLAELEQIGKIEVCIIAEKSVEIGELLKEFENIYKEI